MTPAEIVARLEAQATRQDTPCGSGTIAWRRWGPAAAPPLVFFHGSSGSWTHWLRNIEPFASDHAVWIPDMPGWGDSADPHPADDAQAIIEALDAGLANLIPRETPVTLVAFSAGAIFGAALAERRGPAVRRLILVDVGGIGVPVGDFPPMRSMRGITDPAEIAAIHGHNLGVMMIADPAKIDELAIYLQDLNTRRGRFNIRDYIATDPTLRTLEAIKAPLAMIWGEKDAAHPDLDANRAVLHRLRPGAPFVVIEDTGHWVMYEAADEFNAALRGLIR